MRLVIKVKCNSQVILFDSTEVPSDVVVVVVVDVEGLYDKPNSLEIPSQLIYARLDIDSPSHSLSLSGSLFPSAHSGGALFSAFKHV